MSRIDAVKLQHWTKRIGEWEASGVSQRAYCKQAGHKFATFDYWRRQIRVNGSAGRQERKAASASADRLRLVPVRVAGPAPGDSIVLRSPGGWQLTLPMSIDKPWLAAFLCSLS
jgi:hypothetical protein